MSPLQRLLVAVVAVAAVVAVWIVLASDRTAPSVPSDGESAPVVGEGGLAGDPTEREPVEVPGGADRGIVFRVVDAVSREPVVGVRVWSLRDGRVLAETDGSGRAVVPDRLLASLVFVAEGYVSPLLTFVDAETLRMQRELESGEVVEVRLRSDDVSRRCTVRFVAEDDVPVGAVECTFTPLGVAPPPPDRGWSAFQSAALVVPSEVLPVHFGPASVAVRYTATGEGVLNLRFAAPGRYRVEGSAPTGEAFSSEIDVRQRREFVVRARRDAVVSGVVVDRETSRPVRAARVEAAGYAVETAADGSFVIGPVLEALELEVVAFGFEDALTGPLAPGGMVRIELDPLPRRTFVVEVRAAGRGAPIVGALALCLDVGREAEASETGGDGVARLDVPSAPFRLGVRADGYLAWEEVVSVDEDETTVELVPATLDARLAARVSARVSGRVLGPGGVPRAGAVVHREPLATVDPVDPRPVVRGRPAVHDFVVAGADGRYALECTIAGEYRLWVDDDEARARTLGIVLGVSYDDIDLHTER